MNRSIYILALVAIAAACTKPAAKPLTIQTGAVTRRDLDVEVTATGIIEPINVIEVKSKTASGQVVKMPIEIGTQVQPGDLILQIDTTTDLHTNYKQSLADLAAAKSNFDVSQQQLERQKKLLDARIITQPEFETAQTAFANAQATYLSRQSSSDLAAQKLKDATVNATVKGTIITKPVSLGQVIQAGGTSVSGGTVIATMADLSRVRARALVNETDIGSLQAGQQVNVVVDAFPDQRFSGRVEKIEPMATVQQNVTMFPVLVSLDNSEGLLRPGMNGEVNILTDQRVDALVVPNDAIRSTREAAQAAALLGLNPDSVRAQMGSGRGGGRGGPGGNGGGANGGGGGGNGGGRGTNGGGRGQTQENHGELVLPLVRPLTTPLVQGGGDPQNGQQGGRGGRGGRGGGFQMQVSAEDCKKVDDAMKKKPAVAKKVDDLRLKMREDGADRQAIQGEMKKLYDDLGVDMRTSGACRAQAGGGGFGGGFGGGMGGGNGRGGNTPGGRGGSNGANAGGGGSGGPGGGGNTRNFGGANGRNSGGASSNSSFAMGSRQGGGQGGGTQAGGIGGGRARSRNGLVFVQNGTSWTAKNVRLGVANYDYTEVLDGLKEGDKVALLSVAALQAKRQEQNDRTKAMMGGSPLGGNAGGGRGPGGGGGGPGGGGPGRGQ